MDLSIVIVNYNVKEFLTQCLESIYRSTTHYKYEVIVVDNASTDSGSSCHTLSDTETCSICASPKRDSSIVCVVEDVRDVMAIENTGGYQGTYHVLGGLISPMDGVGPGDLTIDHLIQKLKDGDVEELVFALNTTMEGDTTNFYLYRKIKDFNVKLTTIARGISVGDELEFADEVTLGRSIQQRIPYEQSLPK